MFEIELFLSSQPSAIEKVDWFPECTTEIPDADELRDWMTLAQVLYPHNHLYRDVSAKSLLYIFKSFVFVQRKNKIEDETEFCTENLLHTLLQCKVSYKIKHLLQHKLILNQGMKGQKLL